jgi:hypothetical protein
MQAAGRGGAGTVVHRHEGELSMGVLPGEAPDSMMRPLVYELRRIRRGGKYN